MFHAFPSPPSPPPPPPPPLQLPFRSFFQDTAPLIPRGYYHLQHSPPFPQPLQPYRPHVPPSSPPSPPLPQPAVRLIALQPPRPSILPQASHQVHTTADSVHHVHVFYYYYMPADLAGETFRTGRRDGGGNDRGPRKPCDDPPPAPTTVCPPSYLPPPSPSPPPPPIATPPPPPPQPQLPPTEAPCDDTVVVDSAEYYPFGRISAPIVVAPVGATRDAKGNGSPDGRGAERRPSDRMPEHKSNFILANYLLPPDNK